MGQLNQDTLQDSTPINDMGFVLETMREISQISDPQALVRAYGKRMRSIIAVDGSISLSRRGLELPAYKITRSSRWEGDVNPWREKSRLPIYESGLLSDLIYGDEPVVIDDLKVSPDDPAAEYFQGMRSLVAIPLYEGGQAINMVVLMRTVPGGFDRQRLPMHVWMSNLFGRATNTLVLSNEIKRAYDVVDRELKAVADIQRSLLPSELPPIEGLELAVYYQTSRHAGGDYYDFFKLTGDKWGILMADVSGHGTPAAVLMAITHSIAHVALDPPAPPDRLMHAINSRLAHSYTDGGNFVTAFYGVYDPEHRTLRWCNAGHPPPRLRRADGTCRGLPYAQNLPLGIDADEQFSEHLTHLAPGDTLLFYTDGITEARDAEGNMFDTDRLDELLAAGPMSADQVIQATLSAIEKFGPGQALTDDRTLLAARVL